MVVGSPDTKHIFSIGHSNQSLEQFLSLLKRHEIEAVVDTRSYPVSKFAPHFNQPVLQHSLPRHGIRYVFRGAELGGRPQGEEYYDEEGHVVYARVAEADFFLNGIARLERNVAKLRIALMCTEENPAACHRRLLIGRVLARRGISMIHIRGDGHLQPEHEFIVGEQGHNAGGQQLALFAEPEGSEWKSVQSVLRRSPRASSSGH